MGWFSRIFYGVDLDEEQARGNDLDAKLNALNNQARDSGKYTQEQYEIAMDHASAGAIGDVNQQVWDAAKQGALEGAKGELKLVDTVAGGAASAVKGTLNFAAGTILSAIPWWVFLGAAGYGFWWIGGFKWLKKKAFK